MMTLNSAPISLVGDGGSLVSEIDKLSSALVTKTGINSQIRMAVHKSDCPGLSLYTVTVVFPPRLRSAGRLTVA